MSQRAPLNHGENTMPIGKISDCIYRHKKYKAIKGYDNSKNIIELLFNKKLLISILIPFLLFIPLFYYFKLNLNSLTKPILIVHKTWEHHLFNSTFSNWQSLVQFYAGLSSSVFAYIFIDKNIIFEGMELSREEKIEIKPEVADKIYKKRGIKVLDYVDYIEHSKINLIKIFKKYDYHVKIDYIYSIFFLVHSISSLIIFSIYPDSKINTSVEEFNIALISLSVIAIIVVFYLSNNRLRKIHNTIESIKLTKIEINSLICTT